VGAAAVCLAPCFPCIEWDRVIEVGLQIASVAWGALLGVFLLGVLITRRAKSDVGAIIGMLCGLVTELYLLNTSVPWTWVRSDRDGCDFRDRL